MSIGKFVGFAVNLGVRLALDSYLEKRGLSRRASPKVRHREEGLGREDLAAVLKSNAGRTVAECQRELEAHHDRTVQEAWHAGGEAFRRGVIDEMGG